MAEIRTDNFRAIEVGDDEFHLRVEEEKKDCLECIYAAATSWDGKKYPAIVLRDRIKNKKAYTDTIVDSWWILMQDRVNEIKLLFLELDFKGAGKMKFCLDLSPGFLNKDNREELKIWLQYLILSNGNIALPDGSESSIGASGVTLEIPMLILDGKL